MSFGSAQSLRAPAHIQDLLARLHTLSLEQEQQLGLGNGGPSINNATDALRTGASESDLSFDKKMRDKFIALTEDKAMFVYNLIRAKGAMTVVEAGTSFGVSTIYLALAVGQNATNSGKAASEARVIATEFEPTKAARAREHWKIAGDAVEKYIELREGDILQTLQHDVPSIDFVLFDSMFSVSSSCVFMYLQDLIVWTPMVLPTLKLLEPRLKPGAVIVADNVESSKEGYSDFLNYIGHADSAYSTVMLPYPGGLSMTTFNSSHITATPNEPSSSVFAPSDGTGHFPGSGNHIRIARPTKDISKAELFYIDGLGMEVLYRVIPNDATQAADEHVDDLVMVGWPSASWHLELVLDHSQDAAHACLPQPTAEDLLVVYLDGPVDRIALTRLVDAGGKQVRPKNPYWDLWGVTVEDADGYRIVLSQRRWVNEEARARWVVDKQ